MSDDLLRQLPRSIGDGVNAPTGTCAPKRPDGVSPLRNAVRTGLARADSIWWRLSQRLVREKPSLVTVALHSLCSSRSQIDDPALAPNQNVSIGDFRNLVDTVLEAGYTAVSPTQVVTGLDAGGKYVMFTFDDGYFNNVLALDVLEQYRIPATFFISSNHVLEGKAFWWDALNRALVKAGATEHQRNVEIGRTKALGADRIDVVPAGPFRHPFAAPAKRQGPSFHAGRADQLCPPSLGAPGQPHLRSRDPDRLLARGRCSGRSRTARTPSRRSPAMRPLAISYPNGNHSAAVVEAARAAGLRVGLTVRPCHNRLPLQEGARLMKLGRFYFFWRQRPARGAAEMAGRLHSEQLRQEGLEEGALKSGTALSPWTATAATPCCCCQPCWRSPPATSSAPSAWSTPACATP